MDNRRGTIDKKSLPKEGQTDINLVQVYVDDNHLWVYKEVLVKQKLDGNILAKIEYVAEIRRSLTLQVQVTPNTSHLSAVKKNFLGNPQQEVVQFLGRRLITWALQKANHCGPLQQQKPEYVARL
ncbi:hypothetical protein Tco_0087319 [Tanacetum coccineum]